jgi:DNA-directed RNA polymerases I, II, and III subunit RPABC1
VADEEINMSLADFKAQYANNGGTVECAPLLGVLLRTFDVDHAAIHCSRNQLNFFTNSRTDPSNQIFVFFSDEKSVGVKTMRKCVHSQYTFWPLIWALLRLLNILEEKNIAKGIIIFPGTMTSSARKVPFTPHSSTS